MSKGYAGAVLRAMTTKRKGLARALEMGIASYQYNRAHDLTRRVSLSGAFELFWFYLRNP